MAEELRKSSVRALPQTLHKFAATGWQANGREKLTINLNYISSQSAMRSLFLSLVHSNVHCAGHTDALEHRNKRALPAECS